jgi:hypothetical protein
VGKVNVASLEQATIVQVVVVGVGNNGVNNAIAYPKSENASCVHDEAGGTGSSEDPQLPWR